MKASARLNKVTYAIRDVVIAAREVEATGRKVLKLNIGDPNAYDFDTPQYVKQALFDSVNAGKNGYCDSQGDLSLRRAIVAQNKLRGFDSSEQKIIVSSGLSEGLNLLYGAAMERGENIVMPSPVYPIYEALAHYYEFEPRFYSCVEEEGWQPDIDDLRKKIDAKTRFIALINPNNPTGALYSERVLRQIVDLAGEFKVPIISDEIYDRLVFGGEFVSIGKLARDVPCIIMNGLSKNYFAPGWRLGWMSFLNFGESNPLIEGINQLSRLRLCAPGPMQFAAARALENEAEYAKFLPGALVKLRRRRDLTVKRLNEIAGLHCSSPEGAFYAFPSITAGPWKSDRNFCLELLREAGVLTVFGSGFASAVDSKYFRIVFLPNEQILGEAFDKIEAFMKAKLK